MLLLLLPNLLLSNLLVTAIAECMLFAVDTMLLSTYSSESVSQIRTVADLYENYALATYVIRDKGSKSFVGHRRPSQTRFTVIRTKRSYRLPELVNEVHGIKSTKNERTVLT